MSDTLSDSFYRGGTNVRHDKKDDLIFQALTWEKLDKEQETEEEEEEETEEDSDKKKYVPREFVFRICGATKKGESVSLLVEKYSPYFFLKLPLDFLSSELKGLKQRLLSMGKYAQKDLVDVKLVQAKDVWGFTNEKEYSFAKLIFRTNGAMSTYKKILEESPIDLPGRGKIRLAFYESNLDPMLRFLDLRDLSPSGWVRIPGKALRTPTEANECQIRFNVDWDQLYPYESATIAPLRVASFDIECTSGDGSFPVAERSADAVIQIGMTTRISGSTFCVLRYIGTLGECEQIPKIAHETKEGKVYEHMIVESFKTEKELLLGWAKHVRKVDPDIMIGYNIFGFDWAYLYTRAKLFDCEDAFSRIGRLKGVPCKLQQQKLSSSAMGTNVLKYPEMSGRIQIDLLKVIQREHALPSYKLDNVSKHFLKNAKHDLPPDQIMTRFKSGTPKDLRIIAEYCIQDCILVNDLFDKLSILANTIGMSNVCSVPLSFLFTRGQGIKVFSLIAKTCRRKGYLFPTLPKVTEDSKEPGYEGAIVLDPIPGLYFEPIGVLDYNSLYPNSMIAENISLETLVRDQKYLDLPGYDYNRVEYENWEGSGKNKKSVGTTVCIYAEKKKEKGVIPSLLIDLLDKRKYYKNMMEAEKDPFRESVLNGLQLAYKVTCNSVYGYFGAVFSDLRCQELAASTTATGRKMIYVAKAIVEDGFPGATIVYGDTDSIFCNFSKFESMKDKKGKEAVVETIRLAKLAADLINSKIKKPEKIVYEKTFFPFCIFTKKRYTGHLYENSVDKYKLKSMGLITKRRDIAPIAKRIFQDILDILFKEQDISKAVKFYQTAVSDLLAGNVDMEELILSKTLGANYATPTAITHKVLAERIRERDPGNAPNLNERIPYVFIDAKELKCQVCKKIVNPESCKCITCMGLYCKQHLDSKFKGHPCTPKCRMCWTTKLVHSCGACTGGFCPQHRPIHKCGTINQKVLQGDQVETPDYIREKGLRIDFRYYLDHQVSNPVSQIFELIKDLKDKNILKHLLIKDDNRKSGNQQITAFFSKF